MRFLATPALAFCLTVQTAIPSMFSESPSRVETLATTTTRNISHMAEVRDDVHLHYLDWGGRGPTVLLLAGLGDTAYIFAEAAPTLTTSYRVLALTRRGYGQSDVTQRGYGIQDRIEDIRAFCDKLQLSKIILVGHSAAGDELTAFAQKYPDRLLGLLYLDAAYDRSDPATPKPHMDAWQNVLAQMYGGLSEDQTYASRDARRRALQNLFHANYGVRWNEALESNFIETTTKNADGSLSPRTPGWVPDSIRQGVPTTRLEIPYRSIPTLLVFARGRLENQQFRIPDTQALAVIEKDEDDYEAYFEAYVRQLRLKEPGPRIEILPKDRHYFFLHDPESLGRLLHDLSSE